jgi:CheY-like chemotaxis protein
MEAIGQLTGGLAHDFNNMLAAMKVALGIAQERAGDDVEMRAELDIIAQATTRASQLTSQLLTFSRSQPLPLQIHDVNQLVVALEPMLRRVAIGSIEVKLALSPIVDAVSIDAASFDQALMNLLINARDAMPNGGTFTISTRNVVLDENAALRANVTPGAYVEVQVADTGEGMSSETMNRIFEPFFTTKPVGRGTGLGLATVWGFVKNCGGGIEVWSELGVGTRFTLYLKRVDRPRVGRRKPSSLAPPSASLVPPSGAPDTILVVDDDDLVRRSIAKILERNGYRVVAASGSAEAIDLARSQQGKRIALVIMDVLLPGVTGPELGRRLNEVMPAKILFVSGFSAESAPIEDAKVTPEMLLQKPFTQAALLARVRELMPSA